jgi:hypothetical protein
MGKAKGSPHWEAPPDVQNGVGGGLGVFGAYVFVGVFWTVFSGPPVRLVWKVLGVVVLLVAAGVLVYRAERKRGPVPYTIGAFLRSRVPWVVVGSALILILILVLVPPSYLPAG